MQADSIKLFFSAEKTMTYRLGDTLLSGSKIDAIDYEYFDTGAVRVELHTNGYPAIELFAQTAIIYSDKCNIGANLTHLGSWDSTKTYVPHNIVFYDKASYMCIEACSGVMPSDKVYWKFLMDHI